jgi:nitric oxide dioxygenase
MISSSSRPLIEASVPVLKAHGQEITRVFYQRMFEDHPELMNLFNMGNQANGSQQQSLASALFAYAAHIDHPEALAPVVRRIVHKHASIGVKQEHYPIVGKYLINALKEVLQEAATEDLLFAWNEAYSLLANQMIRAEEEMYAQQNTQAGTWYPMRVHAREQVSADVISLVLKHEDASRSYDFLPGQYVSIAVTLPSGQQQIRQYSLSDAQGLAHWRISIKKVDAHNNTPAGVVSRMLHDGVCVGDVVRVGCPYGDFTPSLDAESPLVLIAGGVGITPMVSILKSLALQKSTRSIMLIHASIDQDHHVHAADVLAVGKDLPQLVVHDVYETLEHAPPSKHQVHLGRVSLDQKMIQAYREGDFYICGAPNFMDNLWQQLIGLGMNPSQIHRELFGPDALSHLM